MHPFLHHSATTAKRDIAAELRRLKEAGDRIIASKEESARFLAATGMYHLKGGLKAQFRK